MSVNEELGESAEKAKEPFERNVAVTMAIIAAALAIVSVLGHVFSNEELLTQQKASDTWAYYQAKSIRRYESDIARDLFKNLNGEASAKLSEKYTGNVEKYKSEGEELQTKARELEAESETKGMHAMRMEFGEIFLEIGIVFASLAILTKRPIVWWVSMICAIIGVGIACTALMIKPEPVAAPGVARVYFPAQSLR